MARRSHMHNLMARLWDSHALAGVPTARAFLLGCDVELSDEALAELLAKARADAESGPYDSAPYYAFVKAANSDVVSALVREVQDGREQVRTLTADNAANLLRLESCRSVTEEWGFGDYGHGTPEREAYDGCHFPAGTQHPGAALLAEMEGLKEERDEAQRYLEREYESRRKRALEHDAEVQRLQATWKNTGDDLRARVAELEAQRAEEWIHIAQIFGAVNFSGSLEALVLAVMRLVSERDAAKQRAKAVRDGLFYSARQSDPYDRKACWCEYRRESSTDAHEHKCAGLREVVANTEAP